MGSTLPNSPPPRMPLALIFLRVTASWGWLWAVPWEGSLLSPIVSLNCWCVTLSCDRVSSLIRPEIPELTTLSSGLFYRPLFIHIMCLFWQFYLSNFLWYNFSSVQFSHSVMSNSLRPRESQHARPPCPSPTPRVHSDSCGSSRWCHPTISSPVVPFSPCPQSLPASGSFPMSQFSWGGQSIGVSASVSVLPMNTQDWSPLGLTGWISLQTKGLTRVFSSTTVQKHQFFSTQLSSQSNSHIHTRPLEKP